MQSSVFAFIISMVFLVTQPLHCEGSSNVTLEKLNSLIIRNMHHQIKTMEESLKLVQMSCGRRVVRPLPVNRGPVIAFHAKLKNNVQNRPHDAKLVFNNVVLNEGLAYNGQTGVFTCPRNGVYVFDWTILTLNGKFFHLDFMVNGNTAARTNNKLPTRSQHSVSSSVVVKMMKGQQAWLEPEGGHVGQYAYGDWTFFSGFKL